MSSTVNKASGHDLKSTPPEAPQDSTANTAHANAAEASTINPSSLNTYSTSTRDSSAALIISPKTALPPPLDQAPSPSTHTQPPPFNISDPALTPPNESQQLRSAFTNKDIQQLKAVLKDIYANCLPGTYVCIRNIDITNENLSYAVHWFNASGIQIASGDRTLTHHGKDQWELYIDFAYVTPEYRGCAFSAYTLQAEQQILQELSPHPQSCIRLLASGAHGEHIGYYAWALFGLTIFLIRRCLTALECMMPIRIGSIDMFQEMI